MLSGLNLPNTVPTKEVILDTIPLSFLLMGIYNKKKEQKIKPIANISFTEEKAKLLALLLHNKKIIVTPHVLAEMSNHCEKNTKNIGNFLAATKNIIHGFDEEHVKIESIMADESLFRLGITDIGLLIVGNKDRALLTGEQRHELDNAYRKLHHAPVLNIQDLFLHFAETGIK